MNESETASTSRPTPDNVKQPRLVSLDALRGFDMFWIVGGDRLLKAFLVVMGFQSAHAVVTEQFRHTPWFGFTAYDLIFPLFLFMSGVTMPFSLGRQLEKGSSRHSIYMKVVRRGLLLVLLGCIYNGLLRLDFVNMRYFSVLGFIGLSWMFAAIIYVNTTWKSRIAWIVGLLLGYWAAMMWVPVPGHGAGVLTREGNLIGFIDRTLLPGRPLWGTFDPEGSFALVSGSCVALLGAMAGQMLVGKNTLSQKWRAVGLLAIFGVSLISTGLLWNTVFPICKQMWTSSFAVLTAGISSILLAVFYTVIDVLGFRRWAFPFVLIGVNAIVIYIGAHRVINFEQITDFFFAGFTNRLGDEWRHFTWSFFFILTELGFLYVLYRKKIFLKV